MSEDFSIKKKKILSLGNLLMHV